MPSLSRSSFLEVVEAEKREPEPRAAWFGHVFKDFFGVQARNRVKNVTFRERFEGGHLSFHLTLTSPTIHATGHATRPAAGAGDLIAGCDAALQIQALASPCEGAEGAL